MTAAQREKLVEPIPMARPGTPEEVAEAVRFCARASSMTQELCHGGWWNCIRTL
jgi:NAD(P)-dependent dehydrogenase (short-subunit alcohol dehydrogenase family)